MGDAGQDLLERAVAGDRDALALLLRQHAPGLARSLKGRIPPRWRSVLSVDDVLQQAFADAFLGIQRFSSHSIEAFAKWLRVIAKRNLCNALEMLETEKRGGNHQRILDHRIAGSIANLLETISTGEAPPSQNLARKDARRALAREIRQLPEIYRCVVRMYDYEGRPAEEIASNLNRSTGAVYMIRARALDHLRERLGSGSQYLSGQ
ncbi:MAG: sigma-70 family RNA polymerase sigma factor [Phycisphaerae bacterium]|nr:sigma-70 family RNA polymerase sigma factor [Phycisphaerae bacterium]